MSNDKQTPREKAIELIDGFINELDDIIEIMMNKETLEKAAEYYAHNNFEMHETNHYKALKQGFEAGAKWQAGNGDTTVNNTPETNTNENITTDKNINHPRWTSTTTWDKMDTNTKMSNTKIANPYEDNHVYIDELMLSIYIDMYLDHGHFDFNVPEWLEDEWEGDAEKDLASAVLDSFRMFLENRDWVDEDNEDRDAAKWGDFIIQ